MYSFLFDTSYISLFVIALLIFLVMFLWRKVTIIEGNFFILEKRVNLMKKESRESSLAKNIERSNIVMNEIFNDAISSDASKSVGTCIFPAKCSVRNAHSDHSDPVITAVSSITNINDNDNDKMIDNDKRNDNDDKMSANDYDDGIKISFSNNDDIDKKIEEANSADDILNAIEKVDRENDNVSIASEFMLGSDDKISQKKLVKMNVDKLKELCLQLNVSPEGTKAQLISRILEKQ